ncbi:hypothetical protein HU762_05920 [Pseudomonas sp. SWRI92]|uniref:Uncharacterized protein n=1 Tax=Pseudomonas marvdashtae TaxID=2745500 RepID=A0A923FQU1_9PSED|nr:MULTISPECIES: hypothetical protein [Pseudomonas]MBC3373478.1 hypothetical protein [Pseudomonas sp. SWRI92]MBV4549752.1 hypothetical protein [Pseudomonas marvdashtae]
MSYQPCTTFEGATEVIKRNGWENGPGASKGELKTDGKNGYWSGQANMYVAEKVMPALHKVFDMVPGTPYWFSFDYRIVSAPSEFFYIKVTDPNRWVMASTPVETNTPVNQWLTGREFGSNMVPSAELWIGLSGPRHLEPFLIEFDNICVRERPMDSWPTATR